MKEPNKRSTEECIALTTAALDFTVLTSDRLFIFFSPRTPLPYLFIPLRVIFSESFPPDVTDVTLRVH